MQVEGRDGALRAVLVGGEGIGYIRLAVVKKRVAFAEEVAELRKGLWSVRTGVDLVLRKQTVSAEMLLLLKALVKRVMNSPLTMRINICLLEQRRLILGV